MNSRVIIIAILIMIKVIGVASRVRADDIYFGQTWENYCNSQFITFEECENPDRTFGDSFPPLNQGEHADRKIGDNFATHNECEDHQLKNWR